MIETREAEAVAAWAANAAPGRLTDYPGAEGYQPITHQVKYLLGVTQREQAAEALKNRREHKERLAREEAAAIEAEALRKARAEAAAAAEAAQPRKTAPAWNRVVDAA